MAFVFLWCLLSFQPIFAILYEQYILTPSLRILRPVSIHNVNGTVTDAVSLTQESGGRATFKDKSGITFDYEKNIAGLVSFTVGKISDQHQFLGLTFSESSLWISGAYSDASTADAGRDKILWFHATKPGTYTVSREHERGGFKYLSLVHNSTGTLEITDVVTHFTAVPHYEEDQLRNYTGYFHSNGMSILLLR
jgi:hypothetical protein